MAENSNIAWADYTFNHVRECEHCYASDLSKRDPGTLGVWGSKASGGERIVAAEAYWKEPVKWNKAAEKSGIRQRVFCASSADVFEDWDGPILNARGKEVLSDHTSKGVDHRPLTMRDVRRRLFELIDATPLLDWMLLTKRPENIKRMWPAFHDSRPLFPGMPGKLGEPLPCLVEGKHRPNVWLGTSAGTQATADKAIPELLECRELSPVLFVSTEPLLESVNLEDWLTSCGAETCNYGESHYRKECDCRHASLDWIIGGGESGPKARPCDIG
jgi:protein gp37